jgi:sialate O-acetylesterase
MSREALAAFPGKIARGAQYADLAYQKQIEEDGRLTLQCWDENLMYNDTGLAEEWFRRETEDQFWNDIQLPGNFSAQKELENFCGVVWLRRNFVLAGSECPEGKSLRLWLGAIVDADTAYINGTKVGEITYRYPPRKYTIPPDLLREGENQITLRVTVNNGEGQITEGKPFAVFQGDDPFAHSAVTLGGAWKYKIGVRSVPRPQTTAIQWQPMGLFNGMIAPLLRYAMRGIVFYQGESNCDTNPAQYGALFTALIGDWRQKAGREELPFLFVQLPLFGPPGENNEESAWAILREGQRSALRLPAVGMAAALDLGEWNDLHPLNKKDIGLRLALAAEQVSGGAKLRPGTRHSVPGPLADAVSRSGNSVTVTFVNSGDGFSSGEKLAAGDTVFVSILTKDGTALRRPARIAQPDCIIVDITGIENPKKILYAWADNPVDRQLYNGAGLPSIPFRFDIPVEHEVSRASGGAP